MCCDGVDCRCRTALHSIITDHFGSDRWFATTELMLMWSNGDRLPPLVTTGADSDSDSDSGSGSDSDSERRGAATQACRSSDSERTAELEAEQARLRKEQLERQVREGEGKEEDGDGRDEGVAIKVQSAEERHADRGRDARCAL